MDKCWKCGKRSCSAGIWKKAGTREWQLMAEMMCCSLWKRLVGMVGGRKSIHRLQSSPGNLHSQDLSYSHKTQITLTGPEFSSHVWNVLSQ